MNFRIFVLLFHALRLNDEFGAAVHPFFDPGKRLIIFSKFRHGINSCSYRPDILLYLLLHILDTAANNAANPTMIDVNCGKQEIAILGTATKTAAYTGTPA